MSYKTDAYLITCITNMHVGSGDANYGVVDNLVQRDVNTGLPTIHSSSLKGAMREFFKDQWGENDDKLNYIFGPDNSRNNGNDGNIGHYKFLPADLLALPVRSNKRPFYRGTSKEVLESIQTKARAFNIDNLTFQTADAAEDTPLVKEGNEVRLEDWESQTDNNLPDIAHIGDDIAFLHINDLKLLGKKLPAIARNQLDNGESKNLWYEEVVPRESRFVCFVSKTLDNGSPRFETEFDQAFNDKLVQIGGNASIGYGFCSIKKIS